MTILLVFRIIAIPAALAAPIVAGWIVAKRNDLSIKLFAALAIPSIIGWMEIFSLLTKRNFYGQPGMWALAACAAFGWYFLWLWLFRSRWPAWQSRFERQRGEKVTKDRGSKTGPLNKTDIIIR
jgi:hypothetical protein